MPELVHKVHTTGKTQWRGMLPPWPSPARLRGPGPCRAWAVPRAMGCVRVHVHMPKCVPRGPYLLMEKILLAKLSSLLFALLPILSLPNCQTLFGDSDGHFLCQTRAMVSAPHVCDVCGPSPHASGNQHAWRGCHHAAECHLGTRPQAAFTGSADLGSAPWLLHCLVGWTREIPGRGRGTPTP